MSKTVPFLTIQFSISTQFKCKYTAGFLKIFLFQAIQFSQTALIQTIQFNISTILVNTLLNVKTVLFETIQFNLSTGFKYQNSSTLSNSFLNKYAIYFYLTHRSDPIKCYHYGSEWTWERWY